MILKFQTQLKQIVLNFTQVNYLILLKKKKNYKKELSKIKNCSKYAKLLKIEVHAGHGMDYKTAAVLKKIKEIEEFNIGHFIIGESIFIGIKKVINKFRKIIN